MRSSQSPVNILRIVSQSVDVKLLLETFVKAEIRFLNFNTYFYGLR